MIALRPYQNDLLDGARQAFRDKVRAVLLQLATGGGKTVSGSYMIHGAAQKGLVCWWLTHRRELIGQTSRTFASMGIVHGIIQGGHSTDPHKLVQIGSIQTVARRLDKLPAPDLIIFDECHHLGAGQWQAIFDAFPDAKIIGLTATPWRLDGVGLGRWFGRMVNGPTVKQLIEAGALSKYRLFAPHVPDLSGVGTQAGDLKKDQLAEVMDKPSVVGDAVEHYKRLCPGKRAVAFAVNIEHSRHIVQQFQLAGIPAEHVDGTMDTTSRDAAIQRFVAGETLVLSNCELFGEGFDVPAIEAVILLRPTKSLSLYLQQVGRALRPAPGKDYAIILDHAGNSLPRELNGQGHGFPDDDREWKLADREKRKAGEKSEVAIRTCPNCFAVYRPVPTCPHCGHVYVAPVREIEQVEGDLKEIDVEALRRAEMLAKKREQGNAQTLEDLIRVGRQRGNRNPEAWARHVLQGRLEAQRYADSIGLTTGQVKAYRKEGMPAASKGVVAALMWIRAEKPAVFQWIEREHPEVMTRAVLDEIAAERMAA
jgi:DNA or RNA helicases of superfamily II